MPCCAAYGCSVKEFNKKSDQPITFHRFPIDPELRNKWILAVKRKNWNPSKTSRLCSKHFKETDFNRSPFYTGLKAGVIPSIFDFQGNNKRKKGKVANDAEAPTMPRPMVNPVRKVEPVRKMESVKTEPGSRLPEIPFVEVKEEMDWDLEREDEEVEDEEETQPPSKRAARDPIVDQPKRDPISRHQRDPIVDQPKRDPISRHQRDPIVEQPPEDIIVERSSIVELPLVLDRPPEQTPVAERRSPVVERPSASERASPAPTIAESVAGEYESAGASVARKLARMDQVQAIYAESLISTILRRGLLNRLKEHTDICDNRCNRRAALASQSAQVTTSIPTGTIIKLEPSDDEDNTTGS